MSKSRGYTFTLNNYTEDDVKSIKLFPCEYLFQEETGASGTRHLQGMLYFRNAVTFNSVKGRMPTAHIEKMKSKIASIKYCSKEDTRTGRMYTNIPGVSASGTPTQEVKEAKSSVSENIAREREMYLYNLDRMLFLYYNDRESLHPEELVEIEEHLAMLRGFRLPGSGLPGW